MNIQPASFEEYIELLQTSGLPTGPFHCPSATEIWWRHHGAGRRFMGLVGRQEGRVVALLPLYTAFLGRVLRPVGFGVAAEFEVAAKKGFLTQFLVQATEWCTTRTPALALDLLDVRLDGPVWQAVRSLQPVDAYSYPCPVIDIRGDWWARLKKKRRHELRRTLARLSERGTLEHRFLEAGDTTDLPALLGQCAAVHAARTAHRLDSSGFSDSTRSAFYREFFSRLVPEGRAAVSCLLLDGKVVSFFAGVVQDQTFVAMLTAFDERHAAASPGQVNLTHLVGALNERGFQTCDLSKGRHEYKTRWATDQYDLHHVVVRLRPGRVAHQTLGRLLTLKDTGRTLGVNEKTRSVIELISHSLS